MDGVEAKKERHETRWLVSFYPKDDSNLWQWQAVVGGRVAMIARRK